MANTPVKEGDIKQVAKECQAEVCNPGGWCNEASCELFKPYHKHRSKQAETHTSEAGCENRDSVAPVATPVRRSIRGT